MFYHLVSSTFSRHLATNSIKLLCVCVYLSVPPICPTCLSYLSVPPILTVSESLPSPPALCLFDLQWHSDVYHLITSAHDSAANFRLGAPVRVHLQRFLSCARIGLLCGFILVKREARTLLLILMVFIGLIEARIMTPEGARSSPRHPEVQGLFFFF